MTPLSFFSSNTLFPPIVAYAFYPLHKLHFAYRILTKTDMYLKYSHEYLCGCGLYLFADNIPFLSAIAQTTLVSERTLTAMQAYRHMMHAIECSKRSFYYFPVPTHLMKKKIFHSLSQHAPLAAHACLHIPQALFDCIYRIMKIVQQIFPVIISMLQLSNAMIELFEASIPNDITRYEGYTQLIINIRKLLGII